MDPSPPDPRPVPEPGWHCLAVDEEAWKAAAPGVAFSMIWIPDGWRVVERTGPIRSGPWVAWNLKIEPPGEMEISIGDADE